MIIIAYVDPGLGLLAWQTLVAFFIGLLFYLKKTRTWISALFNRVFRPGYQPQPPKTAIPASDPERELLGK